MSIDWAILRRRKRLGRAAPAIVWIVRASFVPPLIMTVDLAQNLIPGRQPIIQQLLTSNEYMLCMLLAGLGVVIAMALDFRQSTHTWPRLYKNGIFQCTACGHALDPDAVKQPGAVCPECGAATELEDLRLFWHPGIPRKNSPPKA